ncbi:hypothetical protein [Clostridium sp. UBA5712]|uniref:hypothetical protein n=1 Tax=Clostridium sp. UBA5712 TaxID=1946368 RepID=UPI003217605E
METFFQQSFTVDKVETEELLLKRYSNIDYILNLKFEEGYELISKAYEKDAEEKLWQQWLVDYRLMDQETFISFEEYKSKSRGSSSNTGESEKLTKEQIEDKVKGIIELTLEEGG